MAPSPSYLHSPPRVSPGWQEVSHGGCDSPVSGIDFPPRLFSLKGAVTMNTANLMNLEVLNNPAATAPAPVPGPAACGRPPGL
jgi:hypothetical protein